MRRNYISRSVIYASVAFFLVAMTLLSTAQHEAQAQVAEVPTIALDPSEVVKPWEKRQVFNSNNAAMAAAFDPSGLQGIDLVLPTTLDFGPDGRLYVASQLGTIYAYTIQKNGPQDYVVIDEEQIFEVQVNIDNHDDDGALNNGIAQQNGFQLNLDISRQVTGIVLTGTAETPVMYVSSSDPRHGAGEINGIDDSGLDTNSGVVSRVWKENGSWQKLDLVRGLPRSEENHSVNGMVLDEENNVLYLGIGGLTNAGSPSNNFARITEYALAAAIVSIDLDMIDAMDIQGSGNTAWVYDLPTLDDPTRANANGITDPEDPNYDGVDINDPFGGNNGLNQAKVVIGGPVQLVATGLRNPYDVVMMETAPYTGNLYTIDNGANQGWGGHPVGEGTYPGPNSGQCTNAYDPLEPGSTGPGPNDGQVNNFNGLHFIREIEAGFPYYGGHPTPVRGNPEGSGLYTYFDGVGTFRDSKTGANPLPADWPPVPPGATSEAECDFRNSGVDDGALVNYAPSTNGMTEYTASNFGGELQGAILSAGFGGEIFIAKLNEAGDQVTNGVEILLSNFGLIPLDVIAQGDNDPFPGTIWAATYGEESITVFEPVEVECTGGPGMQDDDNDGYSNDDEIANGTQECNAGDKPSDSDNDFLSDLLDSDDDNDTNDDVTDPFAIDGANGVGTLLPVKYDLFQEDPGTGFFGVGFTGLMANGTTDYLNQFDPTTLIAGGTSGLFTVPSVTEGDAFESLNNQDNGFQFGVDVSSSTAPFEITVRIQPPFFNTQTPQDGQSQGFYLGTGDQDNYIKVVLAANGGNGGIEVLEENAGSAESIMYANNLSGNQAIPDDVLGAETSLNLFLQVDPAAGTVLPGYGVDTNESVYVGSPIPLDGALLSALQSSNQAVAVGLIATSKGPGEPFAATWDRVDVDPLLAGASADIAIATPEDINASTVSGSSFQIENTSTSGQLIQSVTFDLSTAMFPDLVFDPVGSAGDQTGKDFTADQGTESTGFIAGELGDPQNGVNGDDGYQSVTITFNDFEPGEVFGFSIDSDPNNIKGAPAPGPGESGSISGLEMVGATVTVAFDDGTNATAFPFRIPESVSGSQGVAIEGLPEKPSISVLGVPGLQAIVDDLVQTVQVTGPASQKVRLLVLEAALFLPEDGGYNVSPFDANTVIGIQEFEGVTDSDGVVDFEVTISDSQEDAGLNYMVAVVENVDGNTGLVSDVVVLDFDPVNVPTVIARINAGGPGVTANGISWSADGSFNGGSTFENQGIEIANTSDDVIYYTERFDVNMAGLVYDIPVPGDGDYNVALHFAEIFFGAPGGGEEFGGANQRVFSVDVENGQGTITDLDLFDEVGPATALIERFDGVSVTDGAVTVSIVSSVREGKISAIEVSTLGTPGALTASPSSINFNVAEVGGASLPRAITFTNGGSTPLTVSAINLVGADASAFSSNFSSSLNIPAGGSASVDVTFEPESAGAKTAQLEIVYSGEGSPGKVSLTGTAQEVAPGNVLYRVNAGGPSLASIDGLKVWSEDRTVIPQNALGQAQLGASSPYVNADEQGDNTFGTLDSITLDASVASSTPLEIFQTERWDLTSPPELTWSFPVPVGTDVEVRLYFSEIFLTEENNDVDGPRVFDVAVDGVVPDAFNDIDVFAEVGHDVGVVKVFQTSSDGSIDLVFSQDGGNNFPAVKGIEIIDRSSIARAYDAGWNVLGIPVNQSPTSYAVLFDQLSPTVAPYAWSAGDYTVDETVEPGTGFFLNVSTPGLFSYEGEGLESIELQLVQGWNLFAGPSCTVNVSDVIDGEDILIEESLHRYNHGYLPVSQIEPGLGYWVEASAAGSVTLSCNIGTSQGTGGTVGRPNDSFGSLQISDNAFGSQTLYFGGTLENESDIRPYILPPVPPEDGFDARFQDGTRATELSLGTILLQSSEFPLTLKLTRLSEGFVELDLIELDNGQQVGTTTLQIDQSVLITDSGVDALSVAQSTNIEDEFTTLPQAFNLIGNYPNPFNPTTTIVFELPARADVAVEVYDVMGRKVSEVPVQSFAPGRQQVVVQGNDFASGIYLYRVIAQMGAQIDMQVGRMTFLK